MHRMLMMTRMVLLVLQAQATRRHEVCGGKISCLVHSWTCSGVRTLRMGRITQRTWENATQGDVLIYADADADADADANGPRQPVMLLAPACTYYT